MARTSSSASGGRQCTALTSARARYKAPFFEIAAAQAVRDLELADSRTGGLPTGYRRSPVLDPYGRVTGYRIEIDPDTSETIQRIFSSTETDARTERSRLC